MKTMTSEMKPPPSSSSLSSRGLPIDVIVEIAERSDPITLLRCAAACRQLRRAISGEGLRRELRLRNAAGFVPVLLRGFYYQPLHGAHGFLQEPVRFFAAGAGAGDHHGQLPAGDDAVESLAVGFETVEARGGFVVARTGSSSGKVCNPMTGYELPIPLPRKDLVTSYLLLTADDGVGLGASSDDDSELHRFRLLAVQLCQPTNKGRRLRLKMQALTPATGRWGPTTKIPVHGGGGDRHQHPGAELLARHPVVVNGVANFLGVSHSFDRQRPHPPSHYFILRVDVSDHGGDGRNGTTKAATIIPAPEGLKPPSCSRCTSSEAAAAVVTSKQLLLTPSRDRRSVALLVCRTTRVEIHTLDMLATPSAWARATEVVDTAAVRRRPCDLSESEVELHWSGEASGAVVLRLGGTVCQLDRATMAIRTIDEEFPEFRYRSRHMLLPYEMGLSSWVPSISTSA
uniref:F-box domain-containing protein n=1 Tax=Oryza rufipogon TaxID=4529 RepID=A0A0E0RH35_ORYRU